MSVCLFSLSVISLVFFMVFYVLFSDFYKVDEEFLKILCGISVILLFVYGIYFFF